ncbi:hypothetical protein ACLFW1_004296, partial [Cronobacter sakazakii]
KKKYSAVRTITENTEPGRVGMLIVMSACNRDHAGLILPHLVKWHTTQTQSLCFTESGKKSIQSPFLTNGR